MPFIFLQKNLQTLTLYYSTQEILSDSDDEFSNPRYTNDDFLVALLDRAPNLTKLNLDMTDSSISDTQAIKYLTSLHLLQTLIMPPETYTSKIFTAIATLSNLHTIGLTNDSFTHFRSSSAKRFRPKLHEGAFPALRNLSLYASFDDISNFFQQSFAPRNLTRLYIVSGEPSTAESFGSCLKVLASSCQSLDYLQFDMATNAGSQMETQVSYQQLAGLKDLPNLKNFEFSHMYSVSLTNEELGELFSSWASLETFFLTATDHPIASSVPLTLACLPSLAQCCPNLRRLGLYMDATTPVELPTTFKPFASLEELRPGLSPIKDPHTVAAFLSTLCTTGFNLEPESNVDTWQLEDSEYETLSEYCTLWKQVSNLIEDRLGHEV